jgi:uncharacterized protein YndB with AHSA1/START domain
MKHSRVDVTQPSSSELSLSRVFAAPSRLVFEAWTQPELLRRWYGPTGWQLVVCELDLRVGGAWRFVSRQPGGREIGQHGVFRELLPGRRIVQTESWEDWNPGEVLVTTTFEEQADGTRVTTVMRFPSPEVRDMLIKSGMADGYGEAADKLDGLLADQAQR